MSEDNVRVSVEPPPTNQEDQESPGGNDDIVEEVVSSNLPFPGVLSVVSIIFLASMKRRNSA
jgi:hypothetical protein